MDRTGGGKSLVLAMTVIVVRGVTIVVVPLLALTADQLARLNAAVQRYGAVSAIHLNETSSEDLNKKLIPKMDALPYDSSSTLLFLCLPQYLTRTTEFRNVLLRCHAWRTLRLVAIDESHLYAMHGRSFRDSICFLRNVTRHLASSVSTSQSLTSGAEERVTRASTKGADGSVRLRLPPIPLREKCQNVLSRRAFISFLITCEQTLLVLMVGVLSQARNPDFGVSPIMLFHRR